MVRLRVRPGDADAAVEVLQLPPAALHWRSGDPAAHWLGPDHWLLTSDTKRTEEIMRIVAIAMSGLTYAATDTSSGSACFALTGPAARTILAMGCGIDMHNSAFTAGQCVRTHFANVLLFIVAVEENQFDLYVDRSHARYLNDWILDAGVDPITRASKDYSPAFSVSK